MKKQKKKEKSQKNIKPEGEGKELTPQQVLFSKEYLVDFNGTKAAIRAEYSEKSAAEQACRLLRNVKVQEIIKKNVQIRADAVDLSIEWVLERLRELVERCMQLKPVFAKVDGEWIETGEFKFDSTGANKALESIGKYFAMFTEKRKVEGELDLKGLVVNFVIPKGDEDD